MAHRPRHVLFLCTGNSARSILAEALLARLGGGRFAAHSAGSHPTGRVHPETLRVLARHGHPTAGLRSKGCEAFAGGEAPALDFVFTVCDAARGEPCPVWPGHPTTAHWGVEDPAACEGAAAEVRDAFERAYRVLEHRVRRLVDAPLDALEGPELAAELERIGKSRPTPGEAA